MFAVPTQNFKIIMILSILIFTVYGFQPALAQDSVEVKVFIDANSLTVFIGGDQLVSLQGFGFEVVIDENRVTRFLDDYQAFKPLRFNALPTPICFRLERDGSANPIPLECPLKRTLIERLSSSDIFWYDDFSRQTRTLTIIQISAPLDFCATGQSSCEIVYSPPEISATENPSITTEITPDLIIEETQIVSAQVETGSCGNVMPWRLQVGGQGRVSSDESTPSTLRWEPGGQRKGYIQAGESFIVLGGPICTPSNGISWWYVKTTTQVEGWISEGNDGDYWIEPSP